jgi:hypothetical protein
MRSVNFQGKEMTLEQALDDTIRGVQQILNDLQCNLRGMATLEDQKLDDVEDFKEAVKLEDETNDLVSSLTNLLSELPIIAAEIRGETPADKECKAWYAQHKVEVKDKRKKDKIEKIRLAKEAKESSQVASLTRVQE